MKSLKDKILGDGIVLGNNIIKVDSFLNHQIDAQLMYEMGEEFYKRFKECNITKILTIEVSGIAIALTTGQAFGASVVFAKKHKSLNTSNDFYKSTVFSFTKKISYDITVSKEFINENDNILIIDDFLTTGNALEGLVDIIKQSGANLCGVGIVIEKTFQDGGRKLREKGIRIESLTKIKGFENGKVILE